MCKTLAITNAFNGNEHDMKNYEEQKKILGKSVKLQEPIKFDRIDRAHAIENNDHLTDTSIVFNILIFKWMHCAHPRKLCLFGFEQTFIFTLKRLHAMWNQTIKNIFDGATLSL